jgi:hypothetical protein
MTDRYLFFARSRYSESYEPEWAKAARFAEILKTFRPVVSQPASCEMSFCEELMGVMFLDLYESSVTIRFWSLYTFRFSNIVVTVLGKGLLSLWIETVA